MTNNKTIKIAETIIVEGRYDKATLANVIEANIIELGGFRVYKDKEMLGLIRRLADTTGVIVLTDSDASGFQLRNYLNGAVGGKLYHAYIPDIEGKESRKSSPSKEGKLGVEGMSAEILRTAILNAVDNKTAGQSDGGGEQITKFDFYELGLTGTAGSVERRRALARSYQLPERLSADMLISVLNALGVSLQDLHTNLPE